MKRFLLPAVLAAVIVALLLAVGYLLGGRQLGLPLPESVTGPQVSAHTVVKEVLPVGEYASLAYHYTSVVRDISSKDINGWNIPFTTRKYIFTYDGVMKLGIDGTRIRVEEVPLSAGGPEIRVILPPVRILSHEIIDGSIEVFEQSQTIFNEIKIEDAFRVTADRKREMEDKALLGGAVDDAKASLEQQFGSLLRGIPGIKGNYGVVFVWEVPGEASLENPGEASPEVPAAEPENL
ncbi:MAG: DUF4230 domain-containing protein [Treponema sp.]|jgi:hypothetical protein|nr:DUF4230 domain-containing protein [Treponema sp.]